MLTHDWVRDLKSSKLTEVQVDIESNEPAAAPCNIDLPLSSEPVSDVMRESNPPEDLKVVSWPPNPQGVQLGDLQYYAFDERGGEGTFIYVIDSGIEPKNPVSLTFKSILSLLIPNS